MSLLAGQGAAWISIWASKLVFSFLDTSMYVIEGWTNKVWLHAIPKETREAGRRISITFRRADPDLVVQPEQEPEDPPSP